MVNKNFVEELKNILTSDLSVEEKKNSILQYHSNDIAQMLDILTFEERDILFDILNNEEIAEISKSYQDKVVEVLVEGKSKTDENLLTGRTRQNKLVNFTGGSEDIIGQLVNVKITKPRSFSLQGELVK